MPHHMLRTCLCLPLAEHKRLRHPMHGLLLGLEQHVAPPIDMSMWVSLQDEEDIPLQWLEALQLAQAFSDRLLHDMEEV